MVSRRRRRQQQQQGLELLAGDDADVVSICGAGMWGVCVWNGLAEFWFRKRVSVSERHSDVAKAVIGIGFRKFLRPQSQPQSQQSAVKPPQTPTRRARRAWLAAHLLGAEVFFGSLYSFRPMRSV